MIKKLIVSGSVTPLAVALGGWFFRAEILLYLAAQKASAVVAEHRELIWGSTAL